MRDVEGAKFIWYDAIDEILSLTANDNGVPGSMDQGVLVPGMGTLIAPVDLTEKGNGDAEPLLPPRSGPPSSTGIDHESTGSSPRTRATNLIGCRGKRTSSKPTKRAKVVRNLMEALEKLADSTAEIEKLMIETALTMHKENLLDCQENKKLELEMFQLQQASGERMASMFADVLKKSTK